MDVTATKYPTSYTCFNINSTVYVQALPNSGWKFSKWTGNLDISTNPKSFKLSVPRSIVANFVEIPPPDPNSVDDDGDGYSELAGDCNDNNKFVHPGATEICGDGVDNDCVDGDALCREDIDMDKDCFTPRMGDCNDNNSAIHPDMPEICGDGIDQDCSGADLVCPVIPPDPNTIDHDGDGCSIINGDCDDTDPSIHPDAVEIPNDNIDQDCDGADLIVLDPKDIDNDEDGFTENQGDCDDTNSGINPDIMEICGNGIDEDCNGVDLICKPPKKDDDDDNCFINTLK